MLRLEVEAIGGLHQFPALTEAITIEKNDDLARKEAEELTHMITRMAERLEK